MTRPYDDLEKSARLLIDQGGDDRDLVLRLHNLGASILDSIKIIRTVRAVSLGSAKEIVSSHPIWAQVVTASESLHDDAIEAAEQVAKESPSLDT